MVSSSGGGRGEEEGRQKDGPWDSCPYSRTTTHEQPTTLRGLPCDGKQHSRQSTMRQGWKRGRERADLSVDLGEAGPGAEDLGVGDLDQVDLVLGACGGGRRGGSAGGTPPKNLGREDDAQRASMSLMYSAATSFLRQLLKKRSSGRELG